MSSIVESLTDGDYLRGSPFCHGGAQGHKEWWHFCVYGDGVDVLINFSLVDDVRVGAATGAQCGRLTLLVRGDAWHGEVLQFAPDAVRAPAGGHHFVFGDNAVRWRDGRYFIEVNAPSLGITLSMVMTPEAMPSLANNIALEDGPPIHWLVMPRARVDGTMTHRGRTHTFQRAPGYHDHNWGHFRWGQDFAWEWGFALAHDRTNPWSLVFVRLSNRAHTRALMQALFLWRGPYQHRVMRAGELTVRREGLLRPDAVFKVPRVMRLICPSTATDVPARLLVDGQGDGDRLRLAFEANDLAQVIIPNDRTRGQTIIHEVSGAVSLRGAVRGEEVALEGRGIFEFLGA